MNTAEALVARKTEEVRAEYEARGFEVLVHPGPEAVPFELDGYRPDLLARRPDANHLIVVRVGVPGVSVERLMAVVDEVRKHPGWHLTLVTADDVDLVGAPGLDDALPPWPRLCVQASRAMACAHSGMEPDAAFFVLWAAVEGALRKTAECEGIPVERLPTSAVLSSLYSFGGLSHEHYERLLAALVLRNRVAHGFPASRDELERGVNDLMAVLGSLLPKAVDRAA